MVHVCSVCLSVVSGQRIRAIYTPFSFLFNKINLGQQEYIYFFLLLIQNIDCGYSLEPRKTQIVCFEQQ